MNPRRYSDYCCCSSNRPKTLEDLQKEMKKLNKDIEALKEMALDCTTMYKAIDELKEQKAKVLEQMHEALDRMYA